MSMVRRKRQSKPKSAVHNFFTKTTEEEMTSDIVCCKFCDWTSAQNVTRMKKHLLQICKNTPDSVKRVLAAKEGEAADLYEQTEITLSQSLRQDMKDDQEGPIPGPSSAGSELNLSTSEATKKKIDEKWARAMYSTSCPFWLFENKYWREALKPLNYQPPTRKQLSGKLLEEEYQRRLKNVEMKIQKAHNLSIMCDGWSNVRNEGIINIIITTPTPLFVKSVETGNQRQTADYLATILSEVIEKYGVEKFFSVVTDNCSTNKKAWSLLQEKFNHLVCYGCMAHCLNLILTDFLSLPNIKKFVTEGKAIVIEINNNQVLKAELKKKSPITLKLPVKTRWLSLGSFLKSLLSDKKALKELTIDEHVSKKMSLKVKSTIVSEEFWEGVKDLHEIVNTISNHIMNFESNSSNISKCVPAFAEIKQKIQDMKLSSMFYSEKNAMLSIVDKRKIFSIHKIHNLAYLLDPRYLGQNLSQREYTDAVEYLVGLSANVEEGTTQILRDLGHFKLKEGMFASKFIWKYAEETDDIASWWKVCFPKSHLSIIAQKILMSPATSSAVERSFSMQKDVHSLKRNRLKNDTVNKLMHVKSDLQTTACKAGVKSTTSLSIDNTSESETDDETVVVENEPEDPSETLEEETNEADTFEETFEDIIEADPLEETFEDIIEADPLEETFEDRIEADPLEETFEDRIEADPLEETFEADTGEHYIITGPQEEDDDIIEHVDYYED